MLEDIDFYYVDRYATVWSHHHHCHHQLPMFFSVAFTQCINFCSQTRLQLQKSGYGHNPPPPGHNAPRNPPPLPPPQKKSPRTESPSQSFKVDRIPPHTHMFYLIFTYNLLRLYISGSPFDDHDDGHIKCQGVP